MDKKQKYLQDNEENELSETEEKENVIDALVLAGIKGEELAYALHRWEKEE